MVCGVGFLPMLPCTAAAKIHLEWYGVHRPLWEVDVDNWLPGCWEAVTSGCKNYDFESPQLLYNGHDHFRLSTLSHS